MQLNSFSPVLGVGIRAKVEHLGDALAFRFDWSGPILDLGEPVRAGETWARGDGLWSTTCFEAFWSEPGQEAYGELNVSPLRRRWNAYAFDAYRSPQPPRALNNFSLIGATGAADHLCVTLAGGDWPARLDVALCAVVRHPGGLGYFARAHEGPRADFHRRDLFTVRVAAPGAGDVAG